MNDDADPSAGLHKLGELIEGIEVAMLTTHAADGTLVSRPVQTLQFDADGNLYFFTAAGSGKVEEILAHADVNLAYADPARGRYVSVRGQARVERDEAKIRELWSPTQRPFYPQGVDDPRLVVLRVRVRDAAYWEPSGHFLVRAFEFVRAYFSETPSDLGRHGRLDVS
ncbi:MAG TPA: pyridoxamine 5'-phosphate oxidase family protein [Dokdonella sp.]